ncbi:hypothetical protein [Streptomyces sp. MST-110588]|uniref:hypothetical protein n=1 Tax=Streptomyces sp. MST-110588 TaxID=2833628 RepID=UPI001F5CAA9F|nr:hypothetical protein [Streptomyces sp. MST-110588]UNO41108.1 hypothetical protein KGS77_17855 [Streptomyces sp. MST-110588]
MTFARPLPSSGLAEIRIVAATSEVARQVAEALRRRFAGEDALGCPAHSDGSGTVLYLTVDTMREHGRPGPVRPRRTPSDPDTGHAHPDNSG